MRPETLAYQQQIMFELGCAGVSGGSAWSLPVLPQPVQDVGKKTTVAFRLVVSPPEDMDIGHFTLVRSQSRKHFLRAPNQSKGGAEPAAQGFDLSDVFAQDHGPGGLQSITNAVWLDQRIAIPIAPNP